MPLGEYLGPRGLTDLLSFLSCGPIGRERGRPSSASVDMDEFVDLVRRLHVPYYEEARQYFKDPDILSDFPDDIEVYPYLPDTLKEIIAQKSRHG
jgi:hypothetical protein